MLSVHNLHKWVHLLRNRMEMSKTKRWTRLDKLVIICHGLKLVKINPTIEIFQHLEPGYQVASYREPHRGMKVANCPPLSLECCYAHLQHIFLAFSHCSCTPTSICHCFCESKISLILNLLFQKAKNVMTMKKCRLDWVNLSGVLAAMNKYCRFGSVLFNFSTTIPQSTVCFNTNAHSWRLCMCYTLNDNPELWQTQQLNWLSCTHIFKVVGWGRIQFTNIR